MEHPPPQQDQPPTGWTKSQNSSQKSSQAFLPVLEQTSSLDTSMDYEIIALPASGNLQIIPYQPLKIPTALWVGYSVFTTFRTPITAIALKRHLTRLLENGKHLGLEVSFLSATERKPEKIAAYISTEIASAQKGFNQETSLSQMEALLRPFQEAPYRMRLTLIPNIPHIQKLFSSPHVPLPTQLLLSAQPLEPGQKHPINPFSVKTVPHQRMLSHLKHGSYGEDFYLRRQAAILHPFESQEGGHAEKLPAVDFQDVLWTNPDGNLTEASTANIFGIQGNTLITPHPKEDGCLPGIARQFVMDIAQDLGLPLQEGAFQEGKLKEIEGLFLTNSVSGLTPVHRVNDHILPWPSSTLNVFETLKAPYYQRVHGHSD
ncbi:MAG: aminotransferase class IV [Cyanobacteria bacterium]|nr:aminotransferase class IV [Cyanobacteriota bacterium]